MLKVSYLMSLHDLSSSQGDTQLACNVWFQRSKKAVHNQMVEISVAKCMIFMETLVKT